MTGHTRGELRRYAGHWTAYRDDGEWVIGSTRDATREGAAAPDMLRALEELVAEADNPVGWDGHADPDTLGFDWAREAIARARGEA